VNKLGAALIGYSVFSESIYPSAGYSSSIRSMG